MICTQCGKAITDENAFCTNCGARTQSALVSGSAGDQPSDIVPSAFGRFVQKRNEQVSNWFESDSSRSRSELSRLPEEIKKGLLLAATLSAHALPEEIDPVLLLVWLEDTRGTSLQISNDPNGLALALQQCGIWCKETREAAERKGKLYDKSDHSSRMKNYAWLLRRDQSLNFQSLHIKYCEYLAKGVSEIASVTELTVAYDEIRQAVFDWLNKWGIPFHRGPLARIPTTSIQKVLAKFSGMPDVYFSPNIAPEKLGNAVDECGVPEFDSVAVVIDCTFWGSAKDAILLGERGMYYKNSLWVGFFRIPIS